MLGLVSLPLQEQAQARARPPAPLVQAHAWTGLQAAVVPRLPGTAVLTRSFLVGGPVLTCRQLPGIAWHQLHQPLCPGIRHPCVLRL